MKAFFIFLAVIFSATFARADMSPQRFKDDVITALRLNNFNPVNTAVSNSAASLASDFETKLLQEKVSGEYQEVLGKHIVFTSDQHLYSCTAIAFIDKRGAEKVDIFGCSVSYNGRDLIPTTGVGPLQ